MNHIQHRDPLTQRFARTVAETTRDAYAWWEGPREPQHLLGRCFPGSRRVGKRIKRPSRIRCCSWPARLWQAVREWLRAPIVL